MKTLLILAAIITLTQCAPKAFPATSPNPLDTPGSNGAVDVAAIRASHMRAIRGY